MTSEPTSSTLNVSGSTPPDYQPIREKEVSASPDLVKVEELLEFGKTVDPMELFPTLEPGASEFAIKDSYAFVMATCLDRGTKADIIWTIPFNIKKILGHLDPFRINKLTEKQLQGLIFGLPQRPRYLDAGATNSQRIDRDCGFRMRGRCKPNVELEKARRK